MNIDNLTPEQLKQLQDLIDERATEVIARAMPTIRHEALQHIRLEYQRNPRLFRGGGSL